MLSGLARVFRVSVFLALTACGANGPMPAATDDTLWVALDACVPTVAGTVIVPLSGLAVLTAETRPDVFGLQSTEMACVRAAGADCVAVRACLGITIAEDATCTTGAAACEGSVAVTCAPGVAGTPIRIRTDCAHDGRLCVAGACSAPSCTSAAHCDGDVLVTTCPEGERREECPPGTACTGTPAACVATGPACSGDVCEGETLVSCSRDDGHVRAMFACDAYGARCVVESGAGACGATATECMPGGFSPTPPECEGALLRYCGLDGRFRTFACVAHGFEGCISGSASALRSAGARCGAPETLF